MKCLFKYYNIQVLNDIFRDNENGLIGNAVSKYRIHLYLLTAMLYRQNVSDIALLLSSISKHMNFKNIPDYFVKYHLRIIRINTLGHLLLANKSMLDNSLLENCIDRIIYFNNKLEAKCLRSTISGGLTTLKNYFPHKKNFIQDTVAKYSEKTICTTK